VARSRRALLSRLLVLGVIAVGVAAAVSALRGGSQVAAVTTTATAADDAGPGGPGEPLPDLGLGTLPAPGALPGRLVVVEAATCRPRTVDLASLELGRPGPPTGCRAWFDAGGRFGAVSVPDQEGVWLLDVEARSVGRQLSASAEPVVFADDGSAVAQCDADGRTRIVDLDGGPDRVVPGCRPAFAPDGTVLTRPDERLPTSVLRDGVEILGLRQLAGGLSGAVDGAVSVIGYDEGADGLLAVLVALFPGRDQEQDYAPSVQPRLTLELWRGGELERSLRVGGVTSGFGSRVELSPSGSHVLVTSSGHGLLVAVDLRSGEEALRQRQFGVAWSPDGAWLAVATADRIEIRAGATLELVYELPLSVRALGWVGPPDE
jgi:hypothetical protein